MEVVSELEFKHQSPQLRGGEGAWECGGAWLVRRQEVTWREEGEMCKGCGRRMRVRRLLGGQKTRKDVKGGEWEVQGAGEAHESVQVSGWSGDRKWHESAEVPGLSEDRKWGGGRGERCNSEGSGEGPEGGLLGEEAEKMEKALRPGAKSCTLHSEPCLLIDFVHDTEKSRWERKPHWSQLLGAS